MRTKLIVLGLMLCSAPALSQTTTTYTYDSVGRVVKVTPSSGLPTCYKYNRADNRVSVAAQSGCTHTSPPTANADYVVTYYKNPVTAYYGVLGNDTDPDLPADTLSITSVSGYGLSIVNVGGVDALLWSGTATPGVKNFTYYIEDSTGSTSSATLTIEFILCKPADECYEWV